MASTVGALTPKAYNSEEKGCQRCKTQGHKEDIEDLEERDSTTRQRLAMCAHTQPFCYKVGFVQNRLTGNCPLTFYYFVGSVFLASSPFTTRACKGSGSLPPGLCERMLGNTKSSSTGDPLYNATPPALVRQCHKTDPWHQQLGL